MHRLDLLLFLLCKWSPLLGPAASPFPSSALTLYPLEQCSAVHFVLLFALSSYNLLLQRILRLLCHELTLQFLICLCQEGLGTWQHILPCGLHRSTAQTVFCGVSISLSLNMLCAVAFCCTDSVFFHSTVLISEHE